MNNFQKYFEGKEHELLEELCQLSQDCSNCSLAKYCTDDATWEEWVSEEADD